LRTLARGGSSYVVAMPCKKGSEVVTEVLRRRGRFREVRDNLRVKEVWVGEGVRRRRYVVCYNPLEAERQREHRRTVLGELEAELDSLGQGHPRRACGLLASRRFGRYLRRLKDGRLKISKAAIRQAEKRDGIWVIRTNDEGLDGEDLALAYKQLMRVEEAWKTMKSGLEIEPVYHRTPDRIRAHVFLCVLALLIERVAEDACKRPWPRIRRTLQSIKVGQLLTSNGMLYQCSPVQQEARNILKTLKVKPPPEILAAKQ